MKDEDRVNTDEAFNLPNSFKNGAVFIHADWTLVELVNIKYIHTYCLDQKETQIHPIPRRHISLQLPFCSCYWSLYWLADHKSTLKVPSTAFDCVGAGLVKPTSIPWLDTTGSIDSITHYQMGDLSVSMCLCVYEGFRRTEISEPLDGWIDLESYSKKHFNISSTDW